MAYNADNAPELSGTQYREGEWFRANCSRSGTPESQKTKTVLVDEKVEYSFITKRSTNWRDNNPVRQSRIQPVLAPFTPMQMLPVADYVIPDDAFDNIDPVTKIAMHGGSNKGEMRQGVKPRQFAPKLNKLVVVAPKYGQKREGEAQRRAPAVMHAVAAAAVRRGVAERDALIEARRIADLKRGEK